MRVLVIGGGGREHALIKKLKESPEVTELFALPGNGGIAADAVCVPIGAGEIDKIADFAAEHKIDFAVVGPDEPLVRGCVDALEARGVPAFGPNKAAAILEGSKIFSKNLMRRYGIPTAAYESFEDMDAALAYLETAPLPTVIKADGLALGKGVVIAQTRQEARDAVRAMMGDRVFGESGLRVVVEEFLEGPEVSVLAFTDGETVAPMVSSMDHKRAGDGDQGPNTGGMGAGAPNRYCASVMAERCMKGIVLRTMHAMNAEGRTCRGCLYFGLMLTAAGPKVIEYNCRFGDPETQAVLPLLKSDLYPILRAVRDGRLDEVRVEFSGGSACCVVLASRGYPGRYGSGCPLTFPADRADLKVYAAGVKREGETLVSAGGRVLGVTALADTLAQAVEKAYAAAERVDFQTGFYRRDIGARALRAGEGK